MEYLRGNSIAKIVSVLKTISRSIFVPYRVGTTIANSFYGEMVVQN